MHLNLRSLSTPAAPASALDLGDGATVADLFNAAGAAMGSAPASLALTGVASPTLVPAAEPSLPLAALGLGDGATLVALRAAAPTASSPPSTSGRLLGGLMVKVKTLTGKEIEVDIEPSDSIARIKERVEEKEGIPPVQQRLIFAGKQMADDKAAREYGVEGGSVLHLVLALRGGGARA